MTTYVVRAALPLLFKRYAFVYNKSNALHRVKPHRFKQFAKTPNASTSPQNLYPEPLGKHGTPVRGIGGNAAKMRVRQFDKLEFGLV